MAVVVSPPWTTVYPAAKADDPTTETGYREAGWSVPSLHQHDHLKRPAQPPCSGREYRPGPDHVARSFYVADAVCPGEGGEYRECRLGRSVDLGGCLGDGHAAVSAATVASLRMSITLRSMLARVGQVGKRVVKALRTACGALISVVRSVARLLHSCKVRQAVRFLTLGQGFVYGRIRVGPD